jgi:hypothetical protein
MFISLYKAHEIEEMSIKYFQSPYFVLTVILDFIIFPQTLLKVP